ncbi:WRKY transcription factor 23-like [Corylus avellana]|uniref:WRKY transcription factor 23-like n=1 Tax=Corylus avellana TaxID=13451 RepID=UPI001E2265BB|nr:WRKY transcription factor 23-like [Corylus avellana]
MERKEAIKKEETVGSSSFSDHISDSYQFSGIFDFSEGDKSSLGFMELLGVQDYSPSLFDLPHPPSMAPTSPPLPATAVKECSEVLNPPATPNSSISSASSEAVNDHEQTKAVDEEEEEQQEKTKKQLKPKKTNQKRQREPRFAFMTKSEVDHLEDGYRWRKYGQKAVKNSPFPRSYYRCTTSSCNVKKRVERSFTDPSIVVTTYEGQHTHPSPVMPRQMLAGAPPDSSFSAGRATGFAMPMQRSLLCHYQQQQQRQVQQSFIHNLSPSNFACSNGGGLTNPGGGYIREIRFCNTGSGLLRDHGLLQDIVPSHMLKEE